MPCSLIETQTPFRASSVLTNRRQGALSSALSMAEIFFVHCSAATGGWLASGFSHLHGRAFVQVGHAAGGLVGMNRVSRRFEDGCFQFGADQRAYLLSRRVIVGG